MSALSRFEQFIEQVMEGSFTRLLRSKMQPVEIAKRVARAMEDSQAIGPGGKIMVANRFDILLNPKDFSLFEPYRASLERELASYATAAAKERHFTLTDEPLVSITASPKAMPKRPLVKASMSDTQSGREEESAAMAGETTKLKLNLPTSATLRTKAYLRQRSAGSAERIAINRSPFTIGRGLDNNLVLEDVRVSRHHARIEELNKRLLISDLQSTNGTFVNGENVTRSLLSSGDIISLGGLELVLMVEESV